ncbi:MFS general substrate transporter [Suhomyces tanzawaensis NRRL Y-17324]|uniref:MFS general substrate transporter n=1 Tax=Suhomyces tanzawaensis NRRL Y-17324 TaxID=984487 RepID=A0A1E4SCF5_9ASCO|nr:MFS general substrate transporter [Suhomyces tanzawaensis NRRL Y-17324]ODV77175.1 MFS general substrate transporter [Suhomyces tanzawaensis NRRL Y-17324]
MLFTEPFKRMKWGFIPIRRIVDEDEFGNQLETSKDEQQELDRGSSLLNDKAGQDLVTVSKVHQLDYEYRDEKDRKWWKFFDEYEYRVNTKSKKRRKWYKWFHDDDTPEEKRVIWKLDLLLTFYSLMAYWIRYLDQTNLTNAYIGGLKESIGMKGNDFVDTQVMYTVGNIIFQIPFMYILYGLPLNYVLPTLDIFWSILTVAAYRVTDVKQLKVIRFFIGGFESSLYIAYHALFASWFKNSTGEIVRRAGFFYFGQFLGILTSGLLSGAIERNLKGVDGHEAWQWIFIIDGIISAVVGVLGFYMIPGTPQDCYSPFLSDEDIRIARKRMIDDQKDAKPSENPVKYFFKKDVWKSIFTSWPIYIVTPWCAFLWNNNNGTSGAYALWLQSLKNSDGKPRYGAGQLQDYTALTPALGILWLTLTCCIADLFESRWAAITFSQIFNMTGNIILAVWHVPERSKWFAFCLQYFGWSMSPSLYTWQGDICRRDIRSRQVVLVLMNMLAQQTTAWTSILVWKTVEAPRYLKGFSITAAASLALLLWTFVVLYFYKRQERQHARENGIILFNSAVDPDFIPGDVQDTASEEELKKR